MLIVTNADMQIYLITKWILPYFAMLCHRQSRLFVLVYVERGLQELLQLMREDKLC